MRYLSIMTQSRKSASAAPGATPPESFEDLPFDLPEAPGAEDAQERSNGAAPAPPEPRSISARALGRGRALPYLDGLNPEQRMAVEATAGPLLVLAGAGTGKTRVLTTRIAHILAQAKAWPSQILAVTFTNKAAREMKERIGVLIGGAVEGMGWLGTFHSIGVKILRRHAELVGLKSGFTILDDDDTLRLLKQVIEAAAIDKDRWPARQLASQIDGWKNRGLTPDKVPAGEAFAFAEGKGAALYGAYQSRLKDLNACDFGDLLLENLRLLREHPDVLAEYHKRFRYILVDEYQDTNVAQYLWLRLLAQGVPNVCCVGDDDQSVYGWRGAEVENILRFEKDFPGAQVIRLERNYRSTGHILAAASGLIGHNEGRLGKTLFTDGSAGNKVSVASFWDDEAEARSIGDDIETLQRAKHKLNEIAVLVRASFQMRVIEERFITLGLPYRVIGGPKFYERQEIKDAIAYLEVIANPANDLKFERIVNVPKRGIGDTSVKRIHVLARSRNVPMVHAARVLVESDELAGKTRKALYDLLQSFERWRAQIDNMRHTDLAELVLDESGYTSMWQQDKSPQAQSRLENLKELVRFMHDFDTLAGFLEHVSLVMDADQNSDGDRVSLMTMHAAKGLEFETVFLPGWEEGLFPHQRALDESGKAGLEEERRLAYVGLTRAKKLAKLSFAQNRRTHGLYQSAIPSRFVDELPEKNVDVIENPSPYGGGSFGGGFGYGNPFGASRFDNRYQTGGTGSRFDRSPPPGAGFKSSYETPGWQRAKENFSRSDDKKKKRAGRHGAGGPMQIEGKLVAASVNTAPGFAAGVRVKHEKLGEGTVLSVDGDVVKTSFDSGEVKRVVADYLERL